MFEKGLISCFKMEFKKRTSYNNVYFKNQRNIFKTTLIYLVNSDII